VLASHAIKDIISAMENAVLHQSNKFLMLDVPHGTGTNKFASNVLTIGSSTRITFASQSQINALLLIRVEHVNHATMATTLRMENAVLHQSSKFLMSDVQPGTGTSRSAFNAQITGYSTITISVSLFPINALLSIRLEPVNLATKDTILIKENANLPLFNRFLMLDVQHGTGTSRFVFNAQTTGYSTARTFVSQYLINAQPSINQVLVSHATKDTI